MRNALFAILIFAFSFGVKAQVALGGLYTPVNLGLDTTVIYLRDFSADEKVLEITLPEGLTNHSGRFDSLLLTGKLHQKMATLTLKTEAGSKQILLINPSAQAVTFNIPQKEIGFGKDELRLIGSFNNWNRGSEVIEPQNEIYSATYYLEPGRYEYKLFVDKEELLDPTNLEKAPNGMGAFNNVVEVKYQGTAPGNYTLEREENSVYLQTNEQPVSLIVFWENQELVVPCTRSLPARCVINIPKAAKQKKRSYLRIYSFSGGQKGRDQLVPLEYGKPVEKVEELSRLDWHQARLYFLMVDRFKNGNPSNDEPLQDSSVQPLANYMGGDLAGVSQMIDGSYFKDLGVNTIWLSPITQNPTDAWGLWNKGKVNSRFSGYHGYWPVSNVQVDYRFGSEAEVNSLLNKAHAQDNNVILDYVANHVHVNHPVYQNNKDWATNLYLEDSTKNTEKWDEYRLTTWFDDHLPTLDLRRYQIVDPMVDSAMVWLTQYNFDGFRHDATKHIDELYWRTLTYRIRNQTQRPVYQIGETYGSPSLINSYISTGMLDAQFDFNLYDAAVNTFAQGKDHQHLLTVLEQGLNTYGYHHLMGNISGNQDRSRFISLASGDVKFDEDQKLAGWDREIGKPNAAAYKKLALLHAFNNAIPGVPCSYYGDEIGLPGAGDPDNRRMMYFTNWDKNEQELYAKVKELNAIRAKQLALIYGTTEFQLVNDGVLILKRKYFNEEVYVLLNATEKEQAVEMQLKTLDLQVIDQQNPQAENENTDSSILLPPWGYKILSNQP